MEWIATSVETETLTLVGWEQKYLSLFTSNLGLNGNAIGLSRSNTLLCNKLIFSIKEISEGTVISKDNKMSGTFIAQSYIFDFEAANEIMHHDQSASDGILPTGQNYLKSEQHSPLYHQSSIQHHHQLQQQQHHHHQQQQQHTSDDQNKQFDSYYTELGSRDMTLTELELQNNNNSSSFTWSHPGLVGNCQPPELACMVDNLETSLSDQSGLNLSYETDEKFGRGSQGPPSIPGTKKGRGGRKKSQR